MAAEDQPFDPSILSQQPDTTQQMLVLRERVMALPGELGFEETDEMSNMVPDVIDALALSSAGRGRLLGRYNYLGNIVVNQAGSTGERITSQIGKSIAIGNLVRRAGWPGLAMQSYKIGYDTAYTHRGFIDGADVVTSLLPEVLLSEPDAVDIFDALRFTCNLGKNSLDRLKGISNRRALIAVAQGELYQASVKNPAQFLRERGIAA